MKRKSGNAEKHQKGSDDTFQSRVTHQTSNDDPNIFDAGEVSQPQPSPVNSEDLGRTSRGHDHVNTHDTGIGLQDFSLDASFLEQFDPSVQSKLTLITAAHENAKKYLDITVEALNNQKQYLQYMSEQNRDFQLKLESLESELKKEQALKQKAERDLNMWKTESEKAEVTYNKIKVRKKKIQVELAKMYDKYGELMTENQSLRQILEGFSPATEDPRNAGLPARKPKQSAPRAAVETQQESQVRLPPISQSKGRFRGKAKRPGQSSLPPIGQGRRRHGDYGQRDPITSHSSSKRMPQPWYKNADNPSHSFNNKFNEL